VNTLRRARISAMTASGPGITGLLLAPFAPASAAAVAAAAVAASFDLPTITNTTQPSTVSGELQLSDAPKHAEGMQLQQLIALCYISLDVCVCLVTQRLQSTRHLACKPASLQMRGSQGRVVLCHDQVLVMTRGHHDHMRKCRALTFILD
jgi:hypothetical protein